MGGLVLGLIVFKPLQILILSFELFSDWGVVFFIFKISNSVK
jgi:hypothetical protein